MTPTPIEYYHDFSRLGLQVTQRAGIFAPNQRAKEPIISAYILWSIAKLRNRGISPVSFAELFCADAYYAMFARKFWADYACGFDNDKDGFLHQANAAREMLNLSEVELFRLSIDEIPDDRRYSIVANIGGLYHVADPVKVLKKSAQMAQHYLIVQSVVSLADESPGYFEAPAPGWTWGCRFSRAYLEKNILDCGLRIIDSDFNILTGNDRPEDRGSCYFLLKTNTGDKR